MRDGSTHESVKLFLGEPEGAFWEDRYHATAVEHSAHLFRCLVYIDLNMVRAGVVTHPSEWPFSGHGGIQEPRQRYCVDLL
jgi:REP element-mobilizing transposase RayT